MGKREQFLGEIDEVGNIIMSKRPLRVWKTEGSDSSGPSGYGTSITLKIRTMVFEKDRSKLIRREWVGQKAPLWGLTTAWELLPYGYAYGDDIPTATESADHSYRRNRYGRLLTV